MSGAPRQGGKAIDLLARGRGENYIKFLPRVLVGARTRVCIVYCNLERPVIYTGNLTTGMLVGLAVATQTVSFVQGVWERPGWKNRSRETEKLAAILEALASRNERPPQFSAIWTVWWLRGYVSNSGKGRVTLNTTSTETATISLLGIVSFPYMIVVFLVLLVYSVVRRRWVGTLKTNGYSNFEWLISALIAQHQQLRRSSLRGVDDFEQFDILR